MNTVVKMTLLAFVFSSSAMASGGHERGHGRGHGYGHHNQRPQAHYRGHHSHYAPAPAPHVYYREEVRYYAPPPVVYAPAPRYQAAPHNYYDGRNTGGLLGSAVGGVVGYQIGRGDPLAAGIGAAAGSLIGNEIHR